jgi:hypothetical protein
MKLILGPEPPPSDFLSSACPVAHSLLIAFAIAAIFILVEGIQGLAAPLTRTRCLAVSSHKDSSLEGKLIIAASGEKNTRCSAA